MLSSLCPHPKRQVCCTPLFLFRAFHARCSNLCCAFSSVCGTCGPVLWVLGCCLASSRSMLTSKKWQCRGSSELCACLCCMVGRGLLGMWGGLGSGRRRSASAVIARARSGPQPCVRNVRQRRCSRFGWASLCVAWAVSRADGCGLLASRPWRGGAAGRVVCAAPPRAAGRSHDGVLGTAHAGRVAIAHL